MEATLTPSESVAALIDDSAAMNDALLAGDYDEARFRARLIVAEAVACGHEAVVLAAAFVMDRLGPVGSAPRSGFAAGMLGVAQALDAVTYLPL